MKQNKKNLKVSIITINLNNKFGLKKTIKSIQTQNYKKFENIIIDGYSNDGSLEVIKKNKKNFTKIIFKKGDGIYSAINEGLKNAKGDVISILHSGDKYSNKNVLNFVSKNFINSKIDVLFASTKILKNNKVHRVYQGKKVTIRDLKYGLSPPHLSTFVRWKIQKKIGMYNEKFSIASDFNFFVKLNKIKNLRSISSNKILVDMEHGGKSNQGFKSIFIINKEIGLILKQNNIYSNYFFIILRLIFKLKQLINAKNFR